VVKNLMKQVSNREDCFSKTLFTLSRCRVAEDNGFGDLLSRSQMHVDERSEVALTAQRQRNLDALVTRGCSCVATSVAATRIYREDLPRVTTSCNRLGLSLSKRIRHELVEKINGTRRPRGCETLCRILADYSRARRAPVPIASPRHAPPGEVSKRARVFLPFSSPPHTYKCIESNPPYK
jgi:hypothetical protein